MADGFWKDDVFMDTEDNEAADAYLQDFDDVDPEDPQKMNEEDYILAREMRRLAHETKTNERLAARGEFDCFFIKF